MSLARRVLQILSEMPFPSSSGDVRAAKVDYYAITQTGAKGRYQRNIALTQLPAGAQSETAVRSYLQQIHPLNDIQIIKLRFA